MNPRGSSPLGSSPLTQGHSLGRCHHPDPSPIPTGGGAAPGAQQMILSREKIAFPLPVQAAALHFSVPIPPPRSANPFPCLAAERQGSVTTRAARDSGLMELQSQSPFRKTSCQACPAPPAACQGSAAGLMSPPGQGHRCCSWLLVPLQAGWVWETGPGLFQGITAL